MAALQRTAGNETLSHCGKGWVMQPELTLAKCNLKVGSREKSLFLGKWFHNCSQQVFPMHFFFPESYIWSTSDAMLEGSSEARESW